jgi:hypothetical protein
MEVGAKVGHGPHMCIFVLLVCTPIFLLVGHIVYAAIFVWLAIGVNHGSVISAVRVTFFLHLTFLLAITAGDVGVPGPVGTSLTVGLSLPTGIPRGPVPVVASPNYSHQLDFFLKEVLPGNGFGFLWLEFS